MVSIAQKRAVIQFLQATQTKIGGDGTAEHDFQKTQFSRHNWLIL
jgi:hypothetical protein